MDKDFHIKQLSEIINEQAVTIKRLEDKIHQLQHPKNSNTSSIPPSKDENRKTRSLREKSGRKTGGQPGHKGSTLQQVMIPDVVIKHSSDFCQKCGHDISCLHEGLRQRRQVVDLPVTRPLYTEHQCYQRKCTCGHINKAAFPDQVKAPLQYGSSVEATVAYLSTRQYMSYARISEFFRDTYGLSLSEGSVNNLLERFTGKAEVAYRQIQQNIFNSPVVGSDETGAKVNTQRSWIHTWQDKANTFLVISNNRGRKAIDDNFPNGLAKAILVSDAWAAQLGTDARSHQLCTAHLLRELNYFIERYKDNWSIEAKSIFTEAIRLRKQMDEGQFQGSCPERDLLEKRLDDLLDKPPDDKYAKIKPFRKRLIKNRNYLFRFLYNPNVLADNNASERAIRNVKVKQKVSGQFKSYRGVEIFVVIRSVIDTVLKRNGNVFDCLKLTANLAPE